MLAMCASKKGDSWVLPPSASRNKLDRRRLPLLRVRPGLFLKIVLPSGEGTELLCDSVREGEYEVDSKAGTGEGLQLPFDTDPSSLVSDDGVPDDKRS